VDICFDDVHACELAEKNLIVKMKWDLKTD
jgi:hypothetical protein